MVKSMTGYGAGSRKGNGISVSAEMKTVNHRFCEQIVRMPKQYLTLEDAVKKLISQYIHRGRAEVFITIDGEKAKNQKMVVDWQLLDEYYRVLEEMRARFTIKEPVSVSELLQNKDCFQLLDDPVNVEEMESMLLGAVKDAAIQLAVMREAEGRELKTNILALLQSVHQVTDKLKRLAPKVAESYRERLKAKLDSYTSGLVDESRLLTEVAIFAEKADINEELVRLYSHIHQFASIIEESEPVGRRLDFLLQEMNREVNTIGSKGNAAEIASAVVDLKSSLEKMKEQVQNIE
ncbi:YicC family protein [Niallia taxi]|uniref:YicC/YloC family endoribonuclease n=1 Tax=Niallia taxi TaxID=2499688 RepID=UPI0011A0C99A|nr:YicC/YloC family endoribonuclease [Niallia taxi]MCT2344229.1 YicC family protein [Niallia taxi]MDE5051436.1 YicC family protein [Niallia taxi]WOD62128.1 YicC family protein [Niallia taxi]